MTEWALRDRPSLWGVLLFMEGVPPEVSGGLRIGVPPTAGKGGDRQWGDHPAQELHPTPWGGGSSYHWQGAWGGGCQSPRLPDWSWSCHLICCVGREANGAVSKGGGREGGGSVLSQAAPRAPPSFASPTGDATDSFVSSGQRVNPQGLLLAGWLASPGGALAPAKHLELRRFWRSFCSCSRRRLSSLTGLGMKPTSQPSFTSRPIHQSLLYFCKRQRQVGWGRPRGRLEVQASSQLQGTPPPDLPTPPRGRHPQTALVPASDYSPQFSGLSGTSILLCHGPPTPPSTSLF